MSKLIYLIDDNEDIVYSLKYGLKSINPEYEFESGSNKEEIFAKMRTYKIPDLIILDIMLSEETGFDLADQLKKTNEFKKIPIIFLTAKVDEATRYKARFYSKYYLTKPIDMEQLNKIIKSMIY